MFNNLIVAYLFLGGMGAGACGILCVQSIVMLRSGNASRQRFIPCIAHQRFFGFGFLLASTVCAIGAFCLLADMKRPDEILVLLVSPTLSVVSVGAYTLAATILCALFSGLAWLGVLSIPPVVLKVVAVLHGGLSLSVMVYTALLLMTFSGVTFFQSPLLVMLFLVSALSCGAAWITLSASITRTWEALRVSMRRLALTDAALLVMEILLLAVFLLINYGGAPESVSRMIDGELAIPFWLGLFGCGLVAPLALYVIQRSMPSLQVQPILPAALVMVGGFMLRWCIVAAA